MWETVGIISICVIFLILIILIIIYMARTDSVVIKCTNCGKDVSRTIFELNYQKKDICPNCGEKLIPGEVEQKQSADKGETTLSKERIISLFLLWILVSGLFTGLFFLIEPNVRPTASERIQKLRERSPYPAWRLVSWAPQASIIVSIIGLNLAGARVGRYYFRRHKRDVGAWTVAFLLLSPIIAGVIYYYTLTWHKEVNTELKE